MKSRIGFVSNSSSTSFCLITTPETFKKNRDLLNENDLEFINSLLGMGNEFVLDGKQYIDLSSSHDGDSLYYEAKRIFGETDFDYRQILLKFLSSFRDRTDSYIYFK